MGFLVQSILLLLAAHLSHCIDADSRIVTVGSDIELTCSLPDVPHTSIWYFTPLDEVESRELTTSHRVKIQSTSGVSQLSIEYVNEKDSGAYVCQVTATKTGETTSNDILIIVTDNEQAETTTWLPTLSSFETSELPWIPPETSTVEVPFSSSEIPEMYTDTSTLPFTDTSFFSSSTISFDSTPVFDRQPDTPLNTPPVDLEVIALSDVDDDNSVEILVKWEPPYPEAPVDLYTIYYSTNKLAAPSEWASAAVTESSLVSRVRIHPPTYFRVNAINSISQSPLSTTVMFFYQRESASLTNAGPSAQIDQVEPAVVSEAVDETTAVDTETTAVDTETTTVDTETTAVDTETATVNTETATVDTETTTVDTETTTVDTETATVDTETATVDTETATVDTETATVDTETTTVDTETTTVDTETATVDTETATVDRDAPTVVEDGTTLVMNKYTTETATHEPSFATDNSVKLRGETGQPRVGTKSPPASTTPASSPTTLGSLNASANATSNALSSQGILFPAPINFLVERNAVATDRVVVDLSWESLSAQNVSSYVIRFTDSIEEADALWRVFSVKQTAYSLSLKISTTYYFKILAVSTSGMESQASPIYIYNSVEQKSRKCEDTECVSRSPCSKSRYGCCADDVTTATDPQMSNCPHQELCHVSQWGCCSDGVTAAAGPGLLGCAGDAQPCDITEHECCPDGLTSAAGPNFLGCDSKVEELTTLTSLEGQGYNNCSRMSLSLLDGECSRLFNSLSESCQLPSDSGTCTNYTVNWYYDITSGSCRRFWYGGCGGNTNRYTSNEHCQSVCVKPSGLGVCFLSAVPGRCRNFTTRWHFNSETGRCQQFQYGGCVGNHNNFRTERDCQLLCSPNSSVEPDVCSEPQTAGVCRGSFTRWSYSRQSGTCQQFIYSGCGGNKNRFPTPQDCMMKCAPSKHAEQDQCEAEMDSGPCLALIPSWYYDKKTDLCSPFFYGGCAGNSNRYSSQAECHARCSDNKETFSTICRLPVAPGSCADQILSYYYSTESGVCKEFIFSGCGGNKNRFSSLSECTSRCMSSEKPEVCSSQPVCANSCLHGYIVNELGCNTCECRNPCASRPCNSTHQCVVQHLNCFRGLCDSYNTVCIPKGNASAETEYPASITRGQGVGSQFSGSVGYDLTLPCDARGRPSPSVVWYKNRKPLAVNSETNKYFLSDSNFSLTVRDLQPRDRGEYICRASNGVGDPVYEHLTVKVLVGVYIKDGATDITGERNSTLHIHCNAQGSPPPQIMWVFQGELLAPSAGKYSMSERGQILTIFSVDGLDTGDYVCIARNKISSASKTYTVTVRESLTAEFANHSKKYSVSDNLTLTCHTSGYPVAKVEWLKNDQVLPYDPRVSMTLNRLSISSVREGDSGFYTCIASNQYEAVSVTTTIKVTQSTIPPSCQDNTDLADCRLIVKYNFCSHPVYRIYCCRSCLLAAQ